MKERGEGEGEGEGANILLNGGEALGKDGG